jgi:hypothetical protein
MSSTECASFLSQQNTQYGFESIAVWTFAVYVIILVWLEYKETKEQAKPEPSKEGTDRIFFSGFKMYNGVIIEIHVVSCPMLVLDSEVPKEQTKAATWKKGAKYSLCTTEPIFALLSQASLQYTGLA